MTFKPVSPNEKGTYVQCRLSRGNQGTYSWIPKKFAIVGKVLLLKEGEEWEDDWKVEEAWAEAPAEKVIAASRLYMKHRDGTDARRDSDGWKGPNR